MAAAPTKLSLTAAAASPEEEHTHEQRAEQKTSKSAAEKSYLPDEVPLRLLLLLNSRVCAAQQQRWILPYGAGLKPFPALPRALSGRARKLRDARARDGRKEGMAGGGCFVRFSSEEVRAAAWAVPKPSGENEKGSTGGGQRRRQERL